MMNHGGGGAGGGYTTRHRNDVCAPLKNALAGSLFGLLLFAASFPTLWYNEQRAVTEHQTLLDGLKMVAAAAATGSAPKSEGPICLSGPVTGERLDDGAFGVSLDNALTLQRHTAMLQYVEHTRTRTEGRDTVTTYSYTPEWREGAVDSSQFSDPAYRGKNSRGASKAVALTSRSTTARSVRVGQWALSAPAIDSLIQQTLRPVDAQEVVPSSRRLLGSGGAEYPRRGASSDVGVVRGSNDGDGGVATYQTGVGAMSLLHGALYRGSNALAPVVGDERVTFSAALAPEMATVVGRIVPGSKTLHPMVVPSTGKSLFLIEPGDVSVEIMFEHAHDAASLTTWVLRGLGYAACVLGLALLFNVAPAVAGMLPFVGGFLGGLVGVATFLMALLIGTALTLVTIAMAWLASRPLTALLLLGCAAALVFLTGRVRRFYKAKPA